mmetsp:Transcript_24374/g.21628  ORF Transcript_24374/g.21628 Transcript_24374/m.21628 type:complete len:122 (+) Transcript_24374:797-1162(+)
MAKFNGREDTALGGWIFKGERPYERLDLDKINQSGTEPFLSVKEDSSTPSISTLENGVEEKQTVLDKEKPFKLMKENPLIFLNLMIIMGGWMCTSFNSYLLGFNIRNLGGNFYYNAWSFGF